VSSSYLAHFPCIIQGQRLCLMKALGPVASVLESSLWIISFCYYCQLPFAFSEFDILLSTVVCIWIFKVVPAIWGAKLNMHQLLAILGFSILQSLPYIVLNCDHVQFQSLFLHQIHLYNYNQHNDVHTCIHFTIHSGPVSMEYVQPRGPWLQDQYIRSSQKLKTSAPSGWS
jgi:hypothetical protein